MPLHRPAKRSEFVPGMIEVNTALVQQPVQDDQNRLSMKRDALYGRRKLKVDYLLFLVAKGYLTSATSQPSCFPMG